MRYTNADVEQAARRLAEALGHEYRINPYERDEFGAYRAKVGCWTLDYNPTYGGYLIEEVISDGGAISHPFGAMRRKPTEFVETVAFALNAISILRAALEFDSRS